MCSLYSACAKSWLVSEYKLGSLQGKKLSVLRSSQTKSEAHLTFFSLDIPWVKPPGNEPYRSLPFSAKVKNAWSYTSAPQCTFRT